MARLCNLPTSICLYQGNTKSILSLLQSLHGHAATASNYVIVVVVGNSSATHTGVHHVSLNAEIMSPILEFTTNMELLSFRSGTSDPLG